MKSHTQLREIQRLRMVRACHMETARILRKHAPESCPRVPDASRSAMRACVNAARAVNLRLVALKRTLPSIRALTAGLDRDIADLAETLTQPRNRLRQGVSS
jgi:hypothetical protein